MGATESQCHPRQPPLGAEAQGDGQGLQQGDGAPEPVRTGLPGSAANGSKPAARLPLRPAAVSRGTALMLNPRTPRLVANLLRFPRWGLMCFPC